MSTLTYEEACIAAAKNQMPNLWARDEATVRKHLWQTGGFTMALGRVTNEETGAHVMLTEGWTGDDTYLLGFYSSEECEGHDLVEPLTASSAIWWFLAAEVPAGPCPCDPA
jgi:hypothetical protein